MENNTNPVIKKIENESNLAFIAEIQSLNKEELNAKKKDTEKRLSKNNDKLRELDDEKIEIKNKINIITLRMDRLTKKPTRVPYKIKATNKSLEVSQRNLKKQKEKLNSIELEEKEVTKKRNERTIELTTIKKYLEKFHENHSYSNIYINIQTSIFSNAAHRELNPT